MTVLNTTNFIRANGDGIDTTFEFSFPVKTENDVVVKKILNSTGVATTLTITTDYTVTLNSVTEGGTITYVAAPLSTEDSFIKRALTQDQQTGLPVGGNFPEVSVENEIDRSRMIDIELQEQIGRCIIISETETLTSINAPMGTSAANRATKLWAWNDDGDGLVLGTAIGSFTGDWAVSTAYVIRDLIKDTTTGNIFYCNTAHTSVGADPITTNADSAKWDLLVDAASATASAAAAATSATNAATSETNAATSATNAATSETNAATSATNAATSETNAGTSETNAAASAAAAAASAATTPLNFNDTADPTANSDAANTDGNGVFGEGSQWVNTTTNEVFHCVDDTATTAIWHGDQGVAGATIADSGTPDIFNNGDGGIVDLDGTTAITDFPDAPRAGMFRKVIFNGARTFTHGSGITIPGSANITTAANDYALVYASSTTAFVVLDYVKADGTAIVSSSSNKTEFLVAEWNETQATDPEGASSHRLAILSDGVTDSTQMTWTTPSDFTSITALTIVFTAAGAASPGNAVITFTGEARNSGDNISSGGTSDSIAETTYAVTFDVFAHHDILAAVNGLTLDPSEVLTIQLSRNAADAGDTVNAGLRVMGAIITYA